MSRSIMKLVQNVPVTFGVERTLRQLCCFCAPKQHVKMQISSRLRLTDQIMANCTPHGTKAWSFRSLDMLFEPKKISRITSTFSLKLSIEAIGFAVHMCHTCRIHTRFKFVVPKQMGVQFVPTLNVPERLNSERKASWSNVAVDQEPKLVEQQPQRNTLQFLIHWKSTNTGNPFL